MRIASGEIAIADCELEKEGGDGPKIPGKPLCKMTPDGKADVTRDCSSWKKVPICI